MKTKEVIAMTKRTLGHGLLIMSITGILMTSCGPSTPNLLPSDLDPTGSQIKLSASVRNQRLNHISASLAALGIKNSVLIAGIASAETSLAHCYSEATYHCQGPQSNECGGPVLAGSGDGACSIKQGGIGMFQFDAGTHSQTLSKYRNSILTVKGNTAAVIPFFVNKITYGSSLISSLGLSSINSQQDFVNWMNSIDASGGARFEKWLKMVACLYNGACPGSSLAAQRIERYRTHTRSLLGSMPTSTGGEEETTTTSDCNSKCFIEIYDPYDEDPPTVNLRDQASVKSSKIASIPVGSKVCYMGETDKNGLDHSYKTSQSSTYYKVEFAGEQGWVWQPYAKAPGCVK